MKIKILQVFYDENGLPFKDKERVVHYPIAQGTFMGSSNTTQIRFYYDRMLEEGETTFVAVSKLPNGKIGSKILESHFDSELNENYALLDLSNYYTQYKGDLFISLQGYEGGVRVEEDENGIYQIYGTPTIQATGSIRLAINYATQFVGSGETENVTLQRVLAELATKLGIRQETLHVEGLPEVGNPNVWYVVNDDTNDPSKANIYIWNAVTQTYMWVGDNTLNLGNYYTQEQGEQFEEEIDNRVTNVENELSSVASGSPKGAYANLAAVAAVFPTGNNNIYITLNDGHWCYWNGSAWTDGGVYLSTGNAVPDTRKVANIPLSSDITIGELLSQITDLEFNDKVSFVEAFLYRTINVFNEALQTPETISPHYYFDGEPYSTTQYDNQYNCTAEFELEENQDYYLYMFGISQYFNGKPWADAGNGIFFYDKNHTYLGNSSANSFTTPAGTKYARFNYYKGANNEYNNLAKVKSSCMIIKGTTAPTEYVAYIRKTAIQLIENADTELNQESLNLIKNKPVADVLLFVSPNLFDQSEQTPDTISPHYYVNGVPYSTTQFDNSYNCTALFDIKPNTTYYIYVFGQTYTKPWGAASSGIFFYDADGNYISGSSDYTFTTPANAVKARFNYYKGSGNEYNTLQVIKEHCMLVLGNERPEEYEPYGTTNAKQEINALKERVETLESKVNGNLYVSWDKSTSILSITSKFDKTRDIRVVLKKKGPNSIFDFDTWYLISNTTDTVSTSSGTLYKQNGTDFFGPWVIDAINNVDGDANSGFTGGNHGYDNTGSTVNNSATGRTASLEIRIDGRVKDTFTGYCDRVDIYWVNRIQARNTKKVDGTGREVLEERYHMFTNGFEWKVQGNPMALEDVKVLTYYGLQFSPFGTNDSTNYAEYYGDDTDSQVNMANSSNSTSKNCLGLIKNDFTNNIKIKLFVDNTKGVGRGGLNSLTYSMFVSNQKAYSNFIRNDSGVTLQQNKSIYFEGSYKFEPILDGE